MKVFLNGRIVPKAKAFISIDDRGFLSGDGVYETLRFYAGSPFLLTDHLKRLARSMRRLRLQPAPSAAAIGRAARGTVAANGLLDAVVRITVTRGPGPRGLDPRQCPRPTVLVTATPLPVLPAAMYAKGVAAALVPVVRNDARATPPEVKSISCLNNVLAKMAANDLGVFEGIMLSGRGDISEATISNVFMVKRGVVMTPALDGGLLSGVTRSFVLALARKAGYRVREGRLRPKDLAAADEVFLTSSVMEIVPVSRLIFAHDGGRQATRFRPGPVAADLLRHYRRVTLR